MAFEASVRYATVAKEGETGVIRVHTFCNEECKSVWPNAADECTHDYRAKYNLCISDAASHNSSVYCASIMIHSAYSGNSQSVKMSWIVKERVTDCAPNRLAKSVSSRERYTKK